MQIVGGLVAYGIARGTAIHGSSIDPWKIIFLVTGLLTVVVGIVFLFVMPDNQLNCRWLTQEERLLALERIRVNQQGIGNKHWKLYQVKEALSDPMVWAFFWYALIADIPNGMRYSSLRRRRALLTVCRWHHQLLFPANHVIWLFFRAILTLRHSRRCCRNRHVGCLRIPRRQIWLPSSGLHLWSSPWNPWHGSSRRPPRKHECRPSNRILLDTGHADSFCCAALAYLNERCGLYKEDNSGCDVFGRILCGKHHWSASLPWRQLSPG